MRGVGQGGPKTMTGPRSLGPPAALPSAVITVTSQTWRKKPTLHSLSHSRQAGQQRQIDRGRCHYDFICHSVGLAPNHPLSKYYWQSSALCMLEETPVHGRQDSHQWAIIHQYYKNGQPMSLPLSCVNLVPFPRGGARATHQTNSQGPVDLQPACDPSLWRIICGSWEDHMTHPREEIDFS